jgi:hypothetical protein
MALPIGGSLSFTGEVPDGSSNVDLKFKFERLEYDENGNAGADTEPSFETAEAEIIGADGAQTYTLCLPEQDTDTHSNLVMYLVTRDTDVVVTGVTVTAAEAG